MVDTKIEDEATRLSVAIKLGLLLLAFASLFVGLGVAGMAHGAAWGDLITGIGVGFGFSGSLVAYQAKAQFGKPIRSIVSDN